MAMMTTTTTTMMMMMFMVMKHELNITVDIWNTALRKICGA